MGLPTDVNLMGFHSDVLLMYQSRTDDNLSTGSSIGWIICGIAVALGVFSLVWLAQRLYNWYREHYYGDETQKLVPECKDGE